MTYAMIQIAELQGTTDPIGEGAFYLFGDNENSNRVRAVKVFPIYNGESEPQYWEVYQFNIDRFTHTEVNGEWILSDNFNRPETPVWFSESELFEDVAKSNKLDVDDLIWFLQSYDAKKRANVYLMIARKTSWGHFDQYPIRFKQASSLIEFLEEYKRKND